ncbi:MAG: hypothetical protein KF752_11770 [Pirellulaceae bacterium]|nr:hypothetical protein [Pirellulaceae bacterium]
MVIFDGQQLARGLVLVQCYSSDHWKNQIRDNLGRWAQGGIPRIDFQHEDKKTLAKTLTKLAAGMKDQEIVNKDTGWKIKIDDNAIGKIAGRGNPSAYSLLVLPQLIKSAMPLSLHEVRRSVAGLNDEKVTYHQFGHPVTIHNKLHAAKITVREITQHGLRAYSVHAVEIKEGAPQGPTVRKTSHTSAVGAPSAISIDDAWQKVKKSGNDYYSMFSGGLAAIERYAARRKVASSPGQMTFDDHDGGRWITIGSEHSADGGRHGGHPVYIGKDGEMKTGKFAGKTLDEAFGKKGDADRKQPDNTKPGITMDTRPNHSAKPNDQMGLFGDVANIPKGKVALPPGGESKGKQQSLFDTKGDPDQMLMFDDGVTPEDRLMKPDSAATVFDDAISSGSTPREAAESAQKKLDEDYIYARSSEVGSAGEDLKGSARHKINAWRGLEQAEKDGSAEKLVTRDSLLRLEPTNFMSQAHDKPLLSLTMHYAMRAFPTKPGTRSGTPEKNRQEFLDAYRDVKAKAEELVEKYDDRNAGEAMQELRKFVGDRLSKLRGQKDAGYMSRMTASDRYNQTANDLVSLYNDLNPHSRNKTSVAGKFNIFGKEVERKYGLSISAAVRGDIEAKKAYWANLTKHAQDIIEGASLNDSFGNEKKAVRRFNPSEAYVSYAKREGGRDLSKITADPNKAVKHMVDELQIRGVQWGNSVTDDERKHHAGKVVEAITDLADVVGLHPKDFSLGGKLGLAIGARGKGWASAHYEPGSKVINLTRASGVGALAHEWGHAFDHMLADFKVGPKGPSYMSENSEFTHEIVDDSTGRAFDVPHNAKPHEGYSIREKPRSDVRKAYNAWKESCKPYRERLGKVLQEEVRSGTMSHAKAQNYWGSGREVFARALERHVKHKLEEDGRQNTYLSGLGGDHRLWPNAEEARAMAPAFDAIFEAYRQEKYGSPDKVKFSRREMMQELIAILKYQPSAPQLEAGNYKKKHIRLHGLDISIETAKGEHRRPEWPPMPCDYGYIRGTVGNDKDHVDVFVGPNKSSELVVVVDQVNESGKFDEHKVLIGFSNEASAINQYRKAYTKGWKVGPVTVMTIGQFKAWLKDGAQSKPVSGQVSRYSFKAG